MTEKSNTPYSDTLPARKREAAVQRQLEAHHALYGAFAHAWELVGGMDHLVDFAREDPATFYRLLARMTPGMVPTQAINGDINITVNPALKPTPLDGEYTEVQDIDPEEERI
jgi:hypothetical protein